MSDLIHPHTPTTKNGSFETKGKPGRPKKITEEVRDLSSNPKVAHAENIDPAKVITAEDVAVVAPVISIINFGLGLVESYEAYYRACDAARMREIDFVECSQEFFSHLTKGAKTPYMIVGDPAVYVYVVGTREKCLKQDRLTADEVAGLKTGRTQA